MMRIILSHIDELEAHIRELDSQIDGHMKPDEKKAVDAIKDVTGLGVDSARIVISVIGTDMGRFPTDTHIASWASLCPSSNESAGKRRTGKTRKGNKLLRTTLITCAHSAANSKNSFSHAQFQRVSAHRGSEANGHTLRLPIPCW